MTTNAVTREMTKVFYARLHATEAPLYGMIQLTRFGDRVVVTMAPTVGVISPEVMFHDRTRVRVDDRNRITLGDQDHRVVYRITGWDPDQFAFIVLLEEDHRSD